MFSHEKKEKLSGRDKTGAFDKTKVMLATCEPEHAKPPESNRARNLVRRYFDLHDQGARPVTFCAGPAADIEPAGVVTGHRPKEEHTAKVFCIERTRSGNARIQVKHDPLKSARPIGHTRNESPRTGDRYGRCRGPAPG